MKQVAIHHHHPGPSRRSGGAAAAGGGPNRRGGAAEGRPRRMGGASAAAPVMREAEEFWDVRHGMCLLDPVFGVYYATTKAQKQNFLNVVTNKQAAWW